MVQIYVDADACPVKAEIIRVAERRSLHVHMVSNAWMRLDDSPLVHRVVVPEGPDVADDWIAENISPFDIVITADIPLAARCIEAGALVTGPKGDEFTPASIGAKLAMRNLHTHLREIGEITGGARPFAGKDRSNFLSALENIVRRALRASEQAGKNSK